MFWAVETSHTRKDHSSLRERDFDVQHRHTGVQSLPTDKKAATYKKVSTHFDPLLRKWPRVLGVAWMCGFRRLRRFLAYSGYI